MDHKDEKKLFHVHASMEHRDISELRCAIYQPGYWSMTFTNDHQKVIDLAKETYKKMIDEYEPDSFNKINPQIIISLLLYKDVKKRNDGDKNKYIELTGIRTLYKKIEPELENLASNCLEFNGNDIHFDDNVDFDYINQWMPCHKNDLTYMPPMYENGLSGSRDVYALPH